MGSQCSLLPIMKMKMQLTPVPRRLVVTLCGRMSKWKREAKSLLFWQRPQVVRTLMPLRAWKLTFSRVSLKRSTLSSTTSTTSTISSPTSLIISCSLYLIVLLYIFLNRMFSTPPVMRCIVALVDQRKHLADTFKPVFESDSCFEHGNTLHQQYYEALVTFRASLADVWRLSASCQATHDLAIETWNRERSSHSETCHAEMVRK